MKTRFTLFEKWKVKWKSYSLFSRSEKWNENASRSRSRSEISREFSRNSRESRKFLDFVKYIHHKCCIWVLYITQFLHIMCIISLSRSRGEIAIIIIIIFMVIMVLMLSLLSLIPQTHPMFLQILHRTDIVDLVVVCQQSETFSPHLRW